MRFALLDEDESDEEGTVTVEQPKEDSKDESSMDSDLPVLRLGFDSMVVYDDVHQESSPTSIGRSRYYFDEDADDDLLPVKEWNKEPPIGQSTREALLSTRVSRQTAPTKTLIKYSIQDEQDKFRRDNCADSVEELEETMHQLSLYVKEANTRDENRIPNPAPLQVPVEYMQVAETQRRIRQEMQQEEKQYRSRQEKNRLDIAKLLQVEQRKAEQRSEQKRQQEQAAAAQRVAQERQEEARLQRERDRQEQVQAAKDVEAKKKEEATKVAQEKVAREQAARQFLVKGEKLISELVVLQASVEPFDKSKPMGKRRLAMKKIVNGKVNTLSEDVNKIRSVAAEVAAAIAQAKHDDAQINEQIKNGNREYSSEMTKGKRYFVNLLSQKVIVRVQAEGFNGQRGDGFPLAHMLALVAKEHKDIIPVLAAHVYTVCPTAIPRLPTPSKDATEEELMDNLGMIKTKDGNYETFERFLARTEGLISIVANIMASSPPDHKLFSGGEGAAMWLKRFLSELPSPPQLLPLITAPVLDAFLTGAGHMLANVYPEEFNTYLTQIEQECVPRLDEGAVGKPSATRLRKTLEGGFDKFKTTLPSRAIGELYHGSSETGTRRPSSSAPKGNDGPQQMGNRNNNSNNNSSPFGGGGGGGASAVPNPFGGPAPASSPFGGTQTQSAPSPFGATPAPAPSPFGSQPPQTSMSSVMSGSGGSTFGGGGATTGFAAAAPSPFGSSAPAPSPFGSTPAPAPSPFGGGPAAAPSPFGGGPAVSSAFGGAAPAPTPFGGAAAPSPSPFGGAAPAPSPFGSPAPAAFGALAPSPAPFGGAAPSPSPFGSAAPAPTPFGSPAPAPSGFGASPFGGAAAPAPSPFGGAAPAPSPFGGPSPAPATFGALAPAPSPFGAAAPSPSPFGGGGLAPAPSPFGAAPAPSAFGAAPFGGASNPSSFGGASNQNSFGGGPGFGGNTQDNRQPCRFFAKGQCRFGDQCRYSHTNAGGGGGGDWGGPRR